VKYSKTLSAVCLLQ